MSENARIIRFVLTTLHMHKPAGKEYRLPIRFLGIVSVLLFAFFSVFMFGVVNIEEPDEAVKFAAYFCSLMVLNSTIIYLFVNRSVLQRMVRKIEDNVYTYTDESEIQVKYDWFLERSASSTVVVAIALGTLSGFLLAGLSPLYSIYVTKIITPYVFPSWYPWPDDTIFGFAMTLGAQLVICICACWGYIAIFLILVFTAFEFMRQYKKLSVALATLRSRTEKYVNRDGQYEQVYKEKVIECVKHHRELNKLFGLLQPWWTFLFTVELTASTLTFAMVFYNILKQMNNPQTIFTIIGSAFVVITELFARCAIGEIFLELVIYKTLYMNENIRNVIFYEVDWYGQSLSNKQFLLMFHSMSRKPFVIQAFGIFHASYYTFSVITRMSYNYCNLLRTTLK